MLSELKQDARQKTNNSLKQDFRIKHYSKMLL